MLPWQNAPDELLVATWDSTSFGSFAKLPMHLEGMEPSPFQHEVEYYRQIILDAMYTMASSTDSQESFLIFHLLVLTRGLLSPPYSLCLRFSQLYEVQSLAVFTLESHTLQ